MIKNLFAKDSVPVLFTAVPQGAPADDVSSPGNTVWE